MKSELWFTILLLLGRSSIVTFVHCGNSTDMTTLHSTLLSGYNADVRPGSNYSLGAIQVNVTFFIKALEEFAESSSRLSVAGFLLMSWYDERLTWDSSLYNGIDMTQIKGKSVWTPPIIMSSAYTDMSLVGDGDMYVSITTDGKSQWRAPQLFESICNAVVTYYPFDKQTCELTFIVWGVTTDQVSLNAIESASVFQMFSTSPIWDVTKLEHYDTDMGVSVRLSFQRRSTYFVINMVLPSMFMCMINMFVFKLPADSGERVGFSITVLLAIAVFMSILADALPTSSSPSLALLCYLFIIDMMLSLAIMVCTIYSLRFYLHPEEEKVPKLLGKITKKIRSISCRRKPRNISPHTGDVTIAECTTDDSVTRSSENNMKKLQDRRDAQDNDDDVNVSWNEVGQAFDTFCTWTFPMIGFFVNMGFIFYIAMA